MTGMPTELHATWGASLRKLRRERELTATGLAKAADVSRQHIHLIEAGTVAPSDEVRIRIARALGVEVADIFPYPVTSEAS